jgi:hypothetical protein
VVIVNEDAEHEAQRLEKEARDEAEWLAQHVTQDPELQQEWIRQDNLAYGGLIASASSWCSRSSPEPPWTSPE